MINLTNSRLIDLLVVIPALAVITLVGLVDMAAPTPTVTEAVVEEPAPMDLSVEEAMGAVSQARGDAFWAVPSPQEALDRAHLECQVAHPALAGTQYRRCLGMGNWYVVMTYRLAPSGWGVSPKPMPPSKGWWERK